jgi:hypothetical protein
MSNGRYVTLDEMQVVDAEANQRHVATVEF